MNPEHVRALEAVEPVAQLKKGARRSLLPSPPPATGSTQQQLVAWLTVALALGADPVARVERYGRHEEARMVLICQSGNRITFERAADAFDARRLERIVVLATGAQVPHYAAADTAAVAGVIVRAADVLAADDSRGEAAEWGRTFLQESEAGIVQVSDLSTPQGRYEALSILSAPRRPADPYTPPAARSVTVADSTTGTRWIRTGDFGAHVRAEGAHMRWSMIHSRMIEVGWQHLGEQQQRQPAGQQKAKANVYSVPGGWDQ